MTVDLTPVELLAGLGVLVSLLWVWRAGARRARAAADAARSGARVLSLTGRVLFTAGLIVGAQWLVISHPSASKWLLLAVLGLPALFASYTLTRALTVTSDSPRRGGRR
jgi:Na+-driven multidrug efflux pump